jgi:hypothetical protein
MVPTLFFYEIVLVALAWLFLMLYWLWPSDPTPVIRPDSNPGYPASVPTNPNRLQD